MSEVDSFQVRVKKAVKGNYQSCMWRSMQSIALYEADRCLTHRYPQLRPFQMKFALFATAVDLLETLDFLDYYDRQEIMFRRKALKDPLTPDVAWRRMTMISREINETILPKAKELIENDDNSEKSHGEICALLLQSMYQENNENSQSKPHPPMWEFNNNNHAFTVFRIYFRGAAEDPNIFPATPPKVVEVPTKKPPNLQGPNNVKGGGDFPLSSVAQFDDSAVLTEEQRQHFVDEGYLHVKQVVPAKLVHAALGAINAALCKPGGNVEVDDDGTRYCPGVGGSDAILNLLKHSKVWTLAQRLLGKGNISDVQRGQIALRPPNPALIAAGGPENKDGSLSPTQWHIDGMGKNEHPPFSLLVGVTLSDALQPNCGNFGVFPNSHKKLLPLLKEKVESGSSWYSNENSTEKPAFHNGVQVLAEAGDAVLVHNLTAHRAVPNASHAIRYQVYFRLKHKDHARNIENGSLLDDLFVEFEGLSKD